MMNDQFTEGKRSKGGVNDRPTQPPPDGAPGAQGPRCNQLCEVYSGDLQRRAHQLGVNCRWLIAQIDKIHAVLCPGETGTWQQRVEQAVKAAEQIQ